MGPSLALHLKLPQHWFQNLATRWTPFVLLVVASALLSAVLIVTNGSLMASGALLAAFIVVFITTYSTTWGFYVFIFLVLLLDQFPPPGFTGPTSDVYFFANLNLVPYIPRFEQGVVTPLEILLFLTISSWFLASSMKRGFDFVKPINAASTLIFFLTIVAALIHGQSKRGDFIISLWETRALFYLGIMIFFVPQVIRTKKDLEGLVWVFIVAISFKAFQGAYRFASLGFSFGHWPNIYETLTNHEDPVFSVTLFILLIGLILYNTHKAQRRTLSWLLGILLLGFVAGQRRASYVSFVVSLCALTVLVSKKQRTMLLKGLGVVLLTFGVYLAVFWNNTSRLGSIAQQIKATVTGEGGLRGEQDLSSTFYRLVENYDLAYSFWRDPVGVGGMPSQSMGWAPIIGRGFGIPFDTPLPLWNADLNKLNRYIPHNEILWIFVKMGAIGAFVFWAFFNVFVYVGTSVFSRASDPYLKVVCLMCTVAVINQLVVSFVDLQLTWHRNMIYLGTLIGLVTTIARLTDQETATRPSDQMAYQ